ncbi:hypothetical protein EXW28_25875 [Bacillus mycoides]|nr:hypothetical protein EXW37_25865 [Bacillus mycoides]QWH36902.1 hypothetical protein EXW28_25875 [Bacillus mycoides]
MNTLKSSINSLFLQTKTENPYIKPYFITALFYYFLLFTKQYTALYSTYNLIKKRSCRFQLLFLFISSI